MKTKLKPCPFCNQPFEVLPVHYLDDSILVRHNSVGCPMATVEKNGAFPAKRTTAKAINARPIEAALRAEIAQAIVYIKTLVKADDDVFLALVDSGRLDGISEFLEMAGREEE